MEPSQEAKVYIWETQVGHAGMRDGDSSVGHASMELPNGQYFSVRPQYPGSVNPFTTFLFPMPVPARNVESLGADSEIEGRGPDRTIMVPLTERQITVISERGDQLRSDMVSWRSMYQLLPGIGLIPVATGVVGAVQWVSRFMGHPVGAGVVLPQATHCSDAITSLLYDAGVSVPERRAPWKITPSDLGNWLAKGKDHFDSNKRRGL